MLAGWRLRQKSSILPTIHKTLQTSQTKRIQHYRRRKQWCRSGRAPSGTRASRNLSYHSPEAETPSTLLQNVDLGPIYTKCDDNDTDLMENNGVGW